MSNNDSEFVYDDYQEASLLLNIGNDTTMADLTSVSTGEITHPYAGSQMTAGDSVVDEHQFTVAVQQDLVGKRFPSISTNTPTSARAEEDGPKLVNPLASGEGKRRFPKLGIQFPKPVETLAANQPVMDAHWFTCTCFACFTSLTWFTWVTWLTSFTSFTWFTVKMSNDK